MNKEQEKMTFELFARVKFDLQPAYKQTAPPDPDIVFKIGSKEIGLEIVEIQSDALPSQKGGSQIARFENELAIVLKCVEDFFMKSYPTGYILSIQLNHSLLKYSRSTVLKQVQSVVRLSIEKCGDISPEQLWKYSFISHLHIEQISVEEESFVVSSSAYWAPTLDFEHVKEYIGRKNEKRQQYTTGYTEYWLLLVYGASASSDFDLNATNIEQPASDEWDKIFVFNPRIGIVNEWQ